jgi:Trk K+ transport system NAD-binding subunit
MTRIAMHPQVGRGVDVADYRVEEISVPTGAAGAGQTVGEVRGRSVIVALRRGDGQLEAQPSPQAVINAGDTLIVLGPPPALEALEALFQPTRPGVTLAATSPPKPGPQGVSPRA